MKKIAGLGIICMLSAHALLSAPSARAQNPIDPPAAPIPTPVLTAKRVFISNGESPIRWDFRTSLTTRSMHR